MAHLIKSFLGSFVEVHFAEGSERKEFVEFVVEGNERTRRGGVSRTEVSGFGYFSG